jgi:hypothetical protein
VYISLGIRHRPVFISSHQPALDNMEHGIHIATRNSDLDRLMAGRDTRWYKGHLLRLTIIIVSSMARRIGSSLTSLGSCVDHLDDQRFRWKCYERSPDTRNVEGLFR